MPADYERDPLERLSEEFLRRRRQGEALDLEIFAQEHPEHADRVRSLFPTLLQLEGSRDAEPARAEERLGRWRILSELGRGGMGVVYLAEDATTGQRVALKLMTAGSAGAVERFKREAEAVARVEHPEICRVVDIGSDGDRRWIALEHLDGETLADEMRRARRAQEASTGPGAKPRDPEHWFGVAERVARALHVAHEAGLVHRDVKPANLMLTKDGRAVVLDFGLAHDDPTGERTRITHTGVPVGTPAYMSPEQVHAGTTPVDGRTDVYALGASLYEALTLKPPFEGPTIASLFSQILTRDPEPARTLNPILSHDQELVLATALEKRPDRRYKTALDFADDLGRAREGLRVKARAAGPLRRLVSWAARNPVPAAITASVALALTTGLIVALSLLAVVQEARDGEATTARRARARALVSASAETRRSDASLSLLLARAAVRAQHSPETISELHAAVHGSLERTRITGHGRPVCSLAFSADGQTLATGCEDGRARLFSADGSLLCAVPPEDESANTRYLIVALSPSATRWTTLHPDGSARLWSSDGVAVARLDAHTGPVEDVWFLGDDVVAVVGQDGRIALCDGLGVVRRAWRVLPEEASQKRVISSTAVSRSPPALHVLLRSGLAISYDDRGTELRRRREALGSRIATLFDEGRLAFAEMSSVSGGAAEVPKVQFVSADATIVDTWPGVLSPAWKLCGSGTWWCAWTGDGRAAIVDRADGQTRVHDLDVQPSERPSTIYASPDGGRLFTSRSTIPRPGFGEPSTDPIRLWTHSAAPLGSIATTEGVASTAQFSPDGRRLAVGWHSGGLATIHVTAPEELATGVPRWRRKATRYAPLVTADGTHLLYAHHESQIRVIHQHGAEALRFTVPAELQSLDLEPKRGLCLSTGVSGAAWIHGVDGELRRELPEDLRISGASWLGHDGGFTTSTSGPRVRFHDESGNVVQTIDGQPLRPAPTRAYQGEIAIASPGRVSICNARGEVLREYIPESGERPTLYYGSTSGRSLLVLRSGMVKSVFRCFDARGVEIWQATVVALGALAAAVSRDGTRVVIPARGGLSIRDEAGEEVAHVVVPGGLSSVCFGGPESRLLASSLHGNVRVWDREGAWQFDLPSQSGRVIAGFSEDGRRVATVTRAMVGLFTTDVDELQELAARRSTRGFTAEERDTYGEILGSER